MKDRNNVAFYKSAMDQTLMKKPEKNLIEGNDKQLENKNKRQISPVSGGVTKMIVGEGGESDGDNEDDEGWTLATGTRRKTSTELKTGQSAVTPICSVVPCLPSIHQAMPVPLNPLNVCAHSMLLFNQSNFFVCVPF